MLHDGVNLAMCFFLKVGEENMRISLEQLKHGLNSDFLGSENPLSSRGCFNKDRPMSLVLAQESRVGLAPWILCAPYTHLIASVVAQSQAVSPGLLSAPLLPGARWGLGNLFQHLARLLTTVKEEDKQDVYSPQNQFQGSGKKKSVSPDSGWSHYRSSPS